MRIGLLEMHEFCLEFFEGVKAETFLMESSGVADVITSCELDVGSIIYPSFPSARQIRAGQWSFGSGCSSSVAVLQWCSGAVVQWCSGAVVQWCSGAVVQGCSVVCPRKNVFVEDWNQNPLTRTRSRREEQARRGGFRQGEEGGCDESGP
jgi:glycerol-3-phosphate dehydrogenase (NAD+)